MHFYIRMLFVLFCPLLFGCTDNSDKNQNSVEAMSTKEKIAHISKLGYSDDVKNADEIAEFLEDDDSSVVGKACFYLGFLGARKYISRLVGLLQSEDAEVVNMAASGLRLMVNPNDVEILEALYPLLSHEQILPRMSAIDAIGKIQNKKSVGLLVKRFEVEKPAVKLEIIKALGEIKDASTLPLIKGYLVEADSMDAGAPNKGGVRGSDPHPSAMKIVAQEAINKIASMDSKEQGL